MNKELGCDDQNLGQHVSFGEVTWGKMTCYLQAGAQHLHSLQCILCRIYTWPESLCYFQIRIHYTVNKTNENAVANDLKLTMRLGRRNRILQPKGRRYFGIK